MSDVKRVVVTGVKGRMGEALVRRLREEVDFQLVAGTDRKGASSIGLDVGLLLGLGAMEVAVSDSLPLVLQQEKPQVVIDFTSAEASLSHAQACAAAKVALVVGSTGFSPADKAQMAEFAKEIPVVMAPNMSVGVNLMIQTAAHLARVLGDEFDVEVLETHHRLKKDAPSGTAMRLAEVLAQALSRDASNFKMERHGVIGERPPKEIGVQTLRGGDVVGEHTVYFFGEGERIELTHRAGNRDQFARGAVRAARWVTSQTAGLYDMGSVLGLPKV